MPTVTRCASILLLYASVVGSAAFAQEHRGRVLVDGTPLPGVSVTASQNDRTLTTVTNVKGGFQFLSLTAGDWRLHFEMQGFKAVDTTVTIPETTPSAVVQMEMLSLSGLHASSAMTVHVSMPAPVAPVVADGKQRDGTDAPSPPPSPAGSDADMTADGMLINGSNNNAATSKYSLAQAFGTRRAGSKSLYTGSFGFKLSASPFDARPYSLTGLQTPKASYSTFTGVATLGGPIRIPHLFTTAQTSSRLTNGPGTRKPLRSPAWCRRQRNAQASCPPGL